MCDGDGGDTHLPRLLGSPVNIELISQVGGNEDCAHDPAKSREDRLPA